MDWFEFQLLYVSLAHLLVWSLMSSKPANRRRRKSAGDREAADGCSWPEKAAEHQQGPEVSLWGLVPYPRQLGLEAGDQRTGFGEQASEQSHIEDFVLCLGKDFHISQ